tara:strand:- start:3811 stop:4698 length:888 start_codon:yes stop_codon:yes gene_type:complete
MEVKREWFEKDYYSVLGVSPDANEKQIQKAYRKLARDLHPDQNPGDTKAEERFKDVSAAYDVIGDPSTRSKYDEARRMGPGMGGFSPNYSGQSGDISDLINGMFGGGFSQSRSSRPQRGTSHEAQLRLSFDEAITGIETSVTSGTGSGKSKAVKIRIPAGVEDGTRLRLKGKGGQGTDGGPNGDLIVIIRVSEHEIFGREGKNLLIDMPVSFIDAALGIDIEVPTYSDGSKKLRLSAGTQTGSTFRVKGAGISDGELTGDLLVTITVTVPTDLTHIQRTALENLTELFAEDTPDT